jgi:nucleotide-binding universal stress UspA family protein
MPDLLAEDFRVPIGTGAYISPEQLLQNRRDPRSDLFSLGVMLYFFATGERPFGDPLHMSGWRRRLWRDPVPPRRRRPDVPPALQEVILRCLAVEPDERHKTAGDLAADLEHLDSVALTARAARMRRDRSVAVLRRRLRSARERPAGSVGGGARAPVVLVAVDLGTGPGPLDEALRRAVARVVHGDDHARLACVNVLKLSRVLQDDYEDAEGRNLHLVRLAQLRRWARSLPIAPERITYHVLESPDTAAALIEHARANQVDHIVMGARASSVLRRYLGSVSSGVVAQAGCTVTVVRAAAGHPADSPP